MRRIQQYIVLSIFLPLILTAISSCDSGVDIRQEYGFDIRMQKYRTDISEGETKELEFFIDKEGEYENAHYFVSVFLRSGTGYITDGKETLKENVYYEVSPSGFRLYYTSLSKETHKIEVLVKDSFGKEKETVISLSNK